MVIFMGMNSIFLSIKFNYAIHYLPGRNRPSAIEMMSRKESIKNRLSNMVVMLLPLAIFFLFFFLLGKWKWSLSSTIYLLQTSPIYSKRPIGDQWIIQKTLLSDFQTDADLINNEFHCHSPSQISHIWLLYKWRIKLERITGARKD